MSEYAVQAASFTEAIHVGRLNASRTSFTEKQERTDMVLAAVGQYVQAHFNGGMRADFPSLGFVLDVKVTPIDDDDDEPAPTPKAVCTECGERPDEGHGLCRGCFHDATRSGWEPSA